MGTILYRLRLGARFGSVEQSAGSPIAGGNAMDVNFDFSTMRRMDAILLLRQVQMAIQMGAWPPGAHTGVAPLNTVPPVASGTPTVGQTLSCSTGTWTGTLPITYTYQWLRDGSPITGATAGTYTLESADIGAQISCRVTATNVAGSGVADSNQLGPVSNSGVIAETWIEAAYPNPNDSSGWVLAVRGDWPASTFASFDLDPNGTPKLVVNVANRAGFERSGGAAVATTRTKQIVVTTPLRRAYPDSTQTIGFPGAALDETLNADSTRTVRFALAEPVYPGETLTLTALAGWRATLPAESSVAVTNNSTRALLRPWARWAIPQDELVDGTSFTPEIVCVSHTPRHDGSSLHQPVAGVRFVASDGTNTVSAWALGTTESTRYGDSLWCHRAVLDLDTLSSGRVTIHAEVYPWEGAVWTTRDGYWEDPHITQNYKSVTDRGWQVHLDPRPEVPLCIVLDKDGAFLPRLHVVLAPDGSGTATPSEAACVRTTYADAAAIPAADRPSTMGAAIDCMMRVTRSVAAANGFSAISSLRFPGGATVWCPAGTRDLGTTFGSSYTPRLIDYGNVIVRPVPGVGRTDIIFNKASNLTLRIQRLSVRGCTLNSTSSTAMFPNGLPYVELDDVVTQGTNCNIRTGNPVQVFGSTTTGSLDLAHWFTRSEVQAVNSLQGCGAARASRVETHTNAPRLVAAFNCWRQNAVTQTLFDVRWDGCVFLNCRTLAQPSGAASFFSLFGGQATDNPASPATRERVAFVNCLWERTGATTTPGATIGELAYSQARNLIFDGCTTVGARFNFHNDPTGTASNYHFEVTRLGCIFERNATKHDIFSTQPLHTGGWEISYGVRQRDMLSADRFDYVITSNFPHDFVGLNVVKGSLTPGFTTNLGYAEDRSGESHDTALRSTGNGDYRVTSSSFAFNLRSQPCNYPTYVNNVARPSGAHHAGAYPAV